MYTSVGNKYIQQKDSEKVVPFNDKRFSPTSSFCILIGEQYKSKRKNY